MDGLQSANNYSVILFPTASISDITIIVQLGSFFNT